MNMALIPAALRPVAAWTQWFTRLLLGSLYPGAPFERKFMAMLLLETLVTTWNSPDKANRQNFRYSEHPERLFPANAHVYMTPGHSYLALAINAQCADTGSWYLCLRSSCCCQEL